MNERYDISVDLDRIDRHLGVHDANFRAMRKDFEQHVTKTTTEVSMNAEAAVNEVAGPAPANTNTNPSPAAPPPTGPEKVDRDGYMAALVAYHVDFMRVQFTNIYGRPPSPGMEEAVCVRRGRAAAKKEFAEMLEAKEIVLPAKLKTWHKIALAAVGVGAVGVGVGVGVRVVRRRKAARLAGELAATV